MIGPQKFIKPVQDLLPCVQFCTSTPVQDALARALVVADLPYKGEKKYVNQFMFYSNNFF
jgi:hypothetical protein